MVNLSFKMGTVRSKTAGKGAGVWKLCRRKKGAFSNSSPFLKAIRKEESERGHHSLPRVAGQQVAETHSPAIGKAEGKGLVLLEGWHCS